MRAAIFLALMVLTGCRVLGPSYERCDDVPPYAGAKEDPPLAIPEGLDAPDTRSALRIPQLDAPPKPRDGRCTDTPPSYFPNREQGGS